MSSTIKRQNHRLHPCDASRKNELLNHLIALYPSKSILVVTAHDSKAIDIGENGDVTVITDAELPTAPTRRYNLLISYDLPSKALVYMTRLSQTDETALALLCPEDQKFLYPIETLLGRTIIQEPLAGFEPDFGIAAEQKIKEKAKAKRAERDERNAKREERPKRDFKPRTDFKGEKKDSTSRFIGKDENGKPIFSGKTRDRNHYIDGTPRTEAEKAYKTPYSSKPKFYGKEKPESEKTRSADGEKKLYDKKPYEGKKPYDKDKKSYGERKPFGDKATKPFEGKKSYGGKKNPSNNDVKPTNQSNGGKPSSDSAKPAVTPKRSPRRIDVKSFKPADKKEE